MAKVKVVKPETLEALKQVYLSLGEAYQALKSQERYMEEVVKLRAITKEHEWTVSKLRAIIRAHEMESGKKLDTCHECLGVGAYAPWGGGEPSECDQCDGTGVIEIT